VNISIFCRGVSSAHIGHMAGLESTKFTSHNEYC
jgi:hypothetical protein